MSASGRNVGFRAKDARTFGSIIQPPASIGGDVRELTPAPIAEFAS